MSDSEDKKERILNISVIANPLAGKKLSKKVLKLTKKSK